LRAISAFPVVGRIGRSSGKLLFDICEAAVEEKWLPLVVALSLPEQSPLLVTGFDPGASFDLLLLVKYLLTSMA